MEEVPVHESYDKTLTTQNYPPTMTLEQFMVRLEEKLKSKQHQYYWAWCGTMIRLSPVGMLDSWKTCLSYCPIEAVAEEYNAFSFAGAKLGLSVWDTYVIANAADNRMNGGESLDEYSHEEADQAWRQLRPRLIAVIEKYATAKEPEVA